jgi:Flp pilus assembly protein TadG
MPNRFAFRRLLNAARRFTGDSRGNMLVVTTVTTFAIVGASSLVIDHGRKAEAREQLQKIADLAAQAAASPSSLPADPGEARLRRREIAENYVMNSTADVTEALIAGSPVISLSSNSIEVTLHAHFESFWAGVFNLGNGDRRNGTNMQVSSAANW